MVCFFPLLLVAARRLPEGAATTFGTAQSIIVAGPAVIVLGERPPARRLIWNMAGVAGITLVALEPQAWLNALEMAAGSGGAALMGLGVVLTE